MGRGLRAEPSRGPRDEPGGGTPGDGGALGTRCAPGGGRSTVLARPRAMQVRTIAVIVAVVAGLVVYVATAPEPQQAPTPFGGLGGGSSAPAPAGGPTAELAGRPIRLASAITGLHAADVAEAGPAGRQGEHEFARRDCEEHQRRVPRREPGRSVVATRLRGRRRVHRADEGDQALRQGDQRQGRHQRPQDQRRSSRTTTRSTPPASGARARTGPRAAPPRSRSSTASAAGPATTSCASRRRARRRCSRSGPR